MSEQPLASDYPTNWREIANALKERHGWKCERCGHAHEVSTGYVLTVHHLDGDKSNCADWNLAALCQRCHLRIQGRVKMDQFFFEQIIEVSAWFRPHLEGFRRAKLGQTQQDALTPGRPASSAGSSKPHLLGVAGPVSPVSSGDDCRAGVCRCCGQRKPIPVMMHVCRECFEETK